MPTSIIVRAAVVAISIALAPAALGAQRTFVSTGGNDANACSLAAPCRSFGTAIAHTDPDGEIIVLDSGGYGRVTIDRSVTITAPPGVYAGISVFAGTNGIDIATAGVRATLVGLTINGQGGFRGIAATDFTELRVERCVIANMSDDGVNIATAFADVWFRDVTIRNNSGWGVGIGGSLVARFDRVNVERNFSNGFSISGNAKVTISDSRIQRNAVSVAAPAIAVVGAPGGTELAIVDTLLTGNHINAIDVAAVGASFVARVTATRLTITETVGNGISVSASSGGTATATVASTTIARNAGQGVVASGAGAQIAIIGNAPQLAVRPRLRVRCDRVVGWHQRVSRQRERAVQHRAVDDGRQLTLVQSNESVMPSIGSSP
jgi:hypothetical protein